MFFHLDRDRDRYRDNRRQQNWGGDRRDVRDSWRPPPPHWRGGGGGGGGFDRWHGNSNGRNWMENRGGGHNRFGGDRGYRRPMGDGGGHRRDFDHDRDRRDGRRDGGGHRNERDFRDGNRDNRGDDKRNNGRGEPKREKDEKSSRHQHAAVPSTKHYQHNTKQDVPQQSKQLQQSQQPPILPPPQKGGHWNPNVIGPQANNWNNYYSQQSQHQQQSIIKIFFCSGF